MVKVICNSNYIKAEGHANYAEQGKDIVCSAISTLLQTLLIVSRSLDSGYLGYTTREGYIEVEYTGKEPSINNYFKFAIAGLQQIAINYPDYITIAYK